MKKPQSDSKHLVSDGNLEEPNTYLETQKSHKNWYDISEMGKQRGKPKANVRETKKQKGTAKHSLRKEK